MGTESVQTNDNYFCQELSAFFLQRMKIFHVQLLAKLKCTLIFLKDVPINPQTDP